MPCMRSIILIWPGDCISGCHQCCWPGGCSSGTLNSLEVILLRRFGHHEIVSLLFVLQLLQLFHDICPLVIRFISIHILSRDSLQPLDD